MISQAFFNSLVYNAERRGHEFSVSIQHLNKLLEKQKYLCLLSGRQLILPPAGHKHKRTQYNLSLDRINPKEGYVVGNLAWVDKDINMSKQSLTTVEFIHLCRQVVEHNGP